MISTLNDAQEWWVPKEVKHKMDVYCDHWEVAWEDSDMPDWLKKTKPKEGNDTDGNSTDNSTGDGNSTDNSGESKPKKNKISELTGGNADGTNSDKTKDNADASNSDADPSKAESDPAKADADPSKASSDPSKADPNEGVPTELDPSKSAS